MAELCPKCGVRQKGSSEESSMPMVLNVIIGLFGILGVGHIAKGRAVTGIVFLVSGLVVDVLFWTTIL